MVIRALYANKLFSIGSRVHRDKKSCRKLIAGERGQNYKKPTQI